MAITNFFSSYFFPPFSSSSLSSSSSSPQPNNIMSTTSSLNSQSLGGGGDLLNSLSFSSTSMISADEFSTSSTITTPTPSTISPFYDPQTTIPTTTTSSFPSTTPLDSTSAIESLKILLTGIFGNSPGSSTIIDNLGTVLNCSGVRPEEVISKIEQLVLTSTKLLSSSSSLSNDTAEAAMLKTNSTEGSSSSSSLTELYFAKGSSSSSSASSYSASSSSLTAVLESLFEQLNPSGTGNGSSFGSSSSPFCPSRWYGLSCWRETAAGEEAVVSCPSVLNSILYDTTQNASRQCHPNGTWAERANYDRCMPLTTETETTVPSLENIYAPYILYIGYTFSLLALTVALFILLYFKDLRCVRNTIHSNLMITYFLMAIFWIIMDQVQTNTAPISRSISCYMEIGFRYLLATNFFWMFVEGLYLYLLVVKTFSIDMIRTAYYFLIGWGLPAVVILIWVVVKRNFTRTNAMLAELSNSTTTSALPKTPLMSSPLEQIRLRCPYMTADEFDYFYKVPVLIVLFVNIFFLAKIMWLLIIKLRSAQQNQLASTAESKQYRKAAKALLVLIPLLGLGYVLLLVTPTQNTWRFVFKISQAVLTSTQGFTVAVLYCFCNGEVRHSVRHHLSRYRVTRALKVGGDYPTPTNHAYWRPHRCHSASSSASTTTTTTGTNGANGGGAMAMSGGGGGNSRRKHYHFGKLLSADSAMGGGATHNGRNRGARSGSSGSNHFTFAPAVSTGNGTLSSNNDHKRAAKSCSIGTNGSGSGGTPKKGSLGGAGGPRFSNASDSLNAKAYYCPRSPREMGGTGNGGRSRGDSVVSFTTTSSYVIFSSGSGGGVNPEANNRKASTTLATPLNSSEIEETKTITENGTPTANNSSDLSLPSSSSPKAVIHLGEIERGDKRGPLSINDTFSSIYDGLLDNNKLGANSYHHHGYQSVPTTPPPFGEDHLIVGGGGGQFPVEEEEAITIELQPML